MPAPAWWCDAQSARRPRHVAADGGAVGLEAIKLDIYGDDDGAARRDILFSRWEERFMFAKSGAPAIDARPED